ncbi:hypothetical protein DUNSADRAFT_14658 [Dunaliella salina]|uniref:Encoded protein n=1 Tax=Dunaliella salina TaxID=3046 RepID=A0ABQ7G700_DUNSA|nr:hypothetical protein DUNSADRAFT_14658 [Dunaliella salina]|eukprot:KAF5830394.1 hypothetical protein DUNSADRAFT_14658 [Dunaliella salina]
MMCVAGVLLELSNFYQSAGPRARMPAEVQERLLGLLASAESSLAATPGTKQGTREKDTTSGSTLSLFDEKSELEELLPKVRD